MPPSSPPPPVFLPPPAPPIPCSDRLRSRLTACRTLLPAICRSRPTTHKGQRAEHITALIHSVVWLPRHTVFLTPSGVMHTISHLQPASNEIRNTGLQGELTQCGSMIMSNRERLNPSICPSIHLPTHPNNHKPSTHHTTMMTCLQSGSPPQRQSKRNACKSLCSTDSRETMHYTS